MFSIPIPLFILPVLLLAFIVHFALSKKSSLFIRWTAIMALILIGISMVICLFIIFSEPGIVAVKGPDIKFLPENEVVAVVEKSINVPLLIVVALMLFLIAFTVYHAVKEQQRQKNKKLIESKGEKEVKKTTPTRQHPSA